MENKILTEKCEINSRLIHITYIYIHIIYIYKTTVQTKNYNKVWRGFFSNTLSNQYKWISFVIVWVLSEWSSYNLCTFFFILRHYSERFEREGMRFLSFTPSQSCPFRLKTRTPVSKFKFWVVPEDRVGTPSYDILCIIGHHQTVISWLPGGKKNG